jgi:FkbM family methyltransferase
MKSVLKFCVSKTYNFLLGLSINNDLNKLFCLLFKLRFILRNRELKIKEIKIKGINGFEISNINTGLKRSFIIKNQGYLSYHNGLDFRAKDLGENIYMLNLVDFSSNDIVIDIGANLGDLSLYFETIEPEISYFGFEPGEYEYYCLKKNLENKSSHNVFQNALGTINENKDFYYKPKNGDSSLVKMADYTKKTVVQVKTLDTVIEELGIQDRRIKLIKLEAEGYEPEIIMSCKKYINNIEYISADLGFERGENEETTSPAVINFLLQNNFEIVQQQRSRNIFLFKAKTLQ